MTIINPDATVEQILDGVELVIFDSDGVLVEEGEPLPGAQELVNHLLDQGIKVVVLSNNSTKHPKAMQESYHNKGIMVSEIINSSMVTAEFCINNEINRVYVVGEPGLIELLAEYGIIYSIRDVDAVIVGMDRDLTYEKLAIATRLIRQGVRFIGTNPDPSFPTPRGLEPGAGSMIAALIASTDKQPELILGKPEVFGYNFLLEKYNVKAGNCLMIGDRYETDILGAIKASIPALVVNTGIAKTRDNPGKFDRYPEVKVIESLDQLIC